MKNKLNLITLILTILFSFAVTSVVWAECNVEISPSVALVLPGDSIILTAETTCEEGEPNPASYNWEISEKGCMGSSIDPDMGQWTAAADALGCADTIMVTDTANGGITATAIVTISGPPCWPVVNIIGPATLGPPCPASGTYTAETSCDAPIPGTYSWELNGISTGTGNTSNTFEVTCTNDGTMTLMVRENIYGSYTDSMTIQCDCPPLMPLLSEAVFTGCGRPFFYGFGVMTIQGVDTVFGPLTTVSYDSPLVLPLPRLVNRKLQRITQFVILLPSIFFPVWDYPADVTVSVDGLGDTFEIPACGQRQ